jgi:hypothetical protein
MIERQIHHVKVETSSRCAPLRTYAVLPYFMLIVNLPGAYYEYRGTLPAGQMLDTLIDVLTRRKFGSRSIPTACLSTPTFSSILQIYGAHG